MHFKAPPPLDLTRSHETFRSCVTQAGVKTVQRWEDDVTAPCRGTCSPDLDPVQAHTDEHTNTHTTYICAQSFLCTLNISSLEITLAVLRRQRSCYVFFYEGAVSQWLAWIQAHFDRIWGLRSNMLHKRRTYPSPQVAYRVCATLSVGPSSSSSDHSRIKVGLINQSSRLLLTCTTSVHAPGDCK